MDQSEVEAREHFKNAVLAALDLDHGDGLEECYHTLNTFAAYGVGIRFEHIPGSRNRWIVELRRDPVHICYESDLDVVTALKHAFLLFVKELNRHPVNPRFAW